MSSENNILFEQYVNVQNDILENINEIIENNNEDAVHTYRQIITNLNKHLQSIRNVKLNLQNVNDGESSSLKVLQSIESDETTLVDLTDLLHRKIRLRDPPLVVRPIDMLRSYDVIGILNDLADRVSVVEFRNIPYVEELEYLMSVDIFEIQLKYGSDLNRIDCAAIALQALVKRNNRNVNFEKFTESDSPLMLEKLKCLLHYILEVCRMINEKEDDVLVAPIIVKHYIIDPKTISFGSNNNAINIENVSVEKYAPYHKYDNRNSTISPSVQYTVLYVSGKVGEQIFDENASHFDLWCMKCPELYVLPHFIHNTLSDNESYVIRDVKQYNVLANSSYNTKRVYDSEAYDEPLPLLNFLMYESCDYKIHTNAVQSDLSHLNREIAKLMSGVRYEQVLTDDTLVFHTGPYNCHDNRTFQFLIEVLVCASENSKLNYCASNFEQQKELNDTLEAISGYTIGMLYNKLANYNFNTTGPMNFYRG